VRSIALVAVLAVGIIAALVFLLGHRSAIVEAEITLGIVAAALMLFLTMGLYRGVRVQRETMEFYWPDQRSILDGFNGSSLPDIPDLGIDAGEGCLAAIVGLVAAVILGILLLILTWLLINLVWAVWLVLMIALFWVFNRALRIVFARARTCRGNLPNSLRYAALYTLLYTSWLFGLLWAIDWMKH
jgi:hypothetical protein